MNDCDPLQKKLGADAHSERTREAPEKSRSNAPMGQMPDSKEWDTKGLPSARRVYLDSGLTFEEIVSSAVAEALVRKGWVDPCFDPPKWLPGGTRQICFRVQIEPRTYDLFYNAPDGLRGRYWQSPDIGFLATRYLIGAIKPKLLDLAKDNPSILTPSAKSAKRRKAKEMTLRDVETSLDLPSARVWVREDDCAGNKIISFSGPQLSVSRWKQNECEQGGLGQQWRWTPEEDEIEIKGALMTPEGVEYIPVSKLDRSCQIHRYGFT